MAMNTIKIRIDFDGEVKLNNECTVRAPLEMTWFADNDLIIETEFEKIIVNTNFDEVITPKVASKELSVVSVESLNLVKNNVARYLIVDGKYAYKLPNSNLDIV